MLRVNAGHGRRRVVRDSNAGYKYGSRGMHPSVRHLTPLEFTMEWEIMRVTVQREPAAREPLRNADNVVRVKHHAALTVAGAAKIVADNARTDTLKPGEDYIVKHTEGITDGRHWIAFPDEAPSLRHEFVMVRRHCPAAPRFQGRALSQGGTLEDHARHMCFHCRQKRACARVPQILLYRTGRWSKQGCQNSQARQE